MATIQQITAHWNPMLASEWYNRMEQTKNRLRDHVHIKQLTGEATFIDQLGLVEMNQKTSRMATTVLDEMDTYQRVINSTEYDKAIGFDEFDASKLTPQTVPVMETVQKLQQAAERQAEKVIVQGIIGTNTERVVSGGVASFNNLTLPGSQEVAINFNYDGTTANKGLTYDKLVRAKRILMKNEGLHADTPDDQLCCAVTSGQIEDLAQDIRATNRDYVSAVEQLNNGDTDMFLGIKFLRLAETAFDTYDVGPDTAMKLPLWMKSKVCFGMRDETSISIDRRPDRSNALQIRAAMACGASRMQEEGVVLLPCKVNTI